MSKVSSYIWALVVCSTIESVGILPVGLVPRDKERTNANKNTKWQQVCIRKDKHALHMNIRSKLYGLLKKC